MIFGQKLMANHGSWTNTRVLQRFLHCLMAFGLLCTINHPQINGEGYRVCEGFKDEGLEFAAWKIFKPLIYQPSAMSGNHHFMLTHHHNFYSSSSFITGLFLLCDDSLDLQSQRECSLEVLVSH